MHGVNLVLRVLRLFGQRFVARRDSEELEFYYRRITSVKQCKLLPDSQSKNLFFFEFSRVSSGVFPLTNKPEDSGSDLIVEKRFPLKCPSEQRFLPLSLPRGEVRGAPLEITGGGRMGGGGGGVGASPPKNSKQVGNQSHSQNHLYLVWMLQKIHYISFLSLCVSRQPFQNIKIQLIC